MKMKIGFLMCTIATLASHSAQANEWYKVLDCDQGAAVVDNIQGIGRGGAGLAAQLVIRNPQIVQYFSQNQAHGQFLDGQWIGKSYFQPFQGMPGQPHNTPILSFSTVEGSVVRTEGQTLTIVSGGASWTFRDCTRL